MRKVAAKVRFKPVTLRTLGTELTTEPHRQLYQWKKIYTH